MSRVCCWKTATDWEELWIYDFLAGGAPNPPRSGSGKRHSSQLKMATTEFRDESRWKFKEHILEGGPQKGWDLRCEYKLWLKPWMKYRHTHTHPQTHTHVCTGGHGRLREYSKNTDETRGMVNPWKAELLARCADLLHLWQSIFPKLCTQLGWQKSKAWLNFCINGQNSGLAEQLEI